MNLKYRLTVEIYHALHDPDGVVFHHNHSTVDNLFKAVWKNTAHSSGMGLTSTGVEYLTNLLKLQYWDFVAEPTTSANLLMMDRYMTSPYYLSHNKGKNHRNLILFDEEVAAQLILFGKDLTLFLKAHDGASDKPITRH
jgi:hypothetical protein